MDSDIFQRMKTHAKQFPKSDDFLSFSTLFVVKFPAHKSLLAFFS
jgi:hypothetical protein